VDVTFWIQQEPESLCNSRDSGGREGSWQSTMVESLRESHICGSLASLIWI